MFGFHINREWSAGTSPSTKDHLIAAQRFFHKTRAALNKEAKSPAAERVRDALGAKAQPGFAFQIFVAGPRRAKFNMTLEQAHELRDFIRASNDAGNPLWGVAHGTFLDNPWDQSKPRHKWTTSWIKDEVRRAASSGLAGLVIHLGIAPPEDVVQVLPWLILKPEGAQPAPDQDDREILASEGLELLEANAELDVEDGALERWGCFIKSTASVRVDPPKPDAPPQSSQNSPSCSSHEAATIPTCVRLYLEVPHVLPTKSHYETPEKLAVLFRLIRERADPFLTYFGLCIDTAHIWSCGADIASFESAQKWLDGLEAVHDVIPPRAIMFHLNDNVHGLGSGRDEHDPLLRGSIWGEYQHCPEKSGLVAFLDYARRYGIPTVLERKEQKNPQGPDAARLGTVSGAIESDFGELARLGHF